MIQIYNLGNVIISSVFNHCISLMKHLQYNIVRGIPLDYVLTQNSYCSTQILIYFKVIANILTKQNVTNKLIV